MIVKHALILSVDLTKAFDTVSHDISYAKKCFRYGIRGLPLSWVKSYLSNRYQCVRIGSEFF